jgi:hypothetical protein
MKTLVAVAVLAGALAATLTPAAGRASAACDSVDCVPNVAHNVAAGAPCNPHPLFVFGVDPGANTVVCASWGVWTSAGPLVGIREVSQPCFRLNDSAQEYNGVPLQCLNLNNSLEWAHLTG